MDKEIFKRIAVEHGKTVKEIIEHIDMSEAGFYKALKVGSLRVDKLEQFAKVLNISVCEFFDCVQPGQPVHLDFKEKYYTVLEKNSLLLEDNTELRRQIAQLQRAVQ